MDPTSCLGFAEVKTLDFWRAVFGEFIVTLVYIIMAIMGGMGLGKHEPSILHISLNTGLIVTMLASAFWNISGGHFNPAVSIALAVRRSISILRCTLYIIAQCAGTIAGSALLYLYTPSKYRGNLGALSLHEDLHSAIGFLVEVTLTYPFILTVISSTDPLKEFVGYQPPLAIGLSVTVGLLSGIPYTGAALNPIRVLGPAVVMDKYEHHWVYWAGPIVGCVLAAVSYDYLFTLTENKKRSTEKDTTTSGCI